MSEAARRLRAQLAEDRPVLAIGGHSPLAAVLAEEAGFDVVWASGFEISAAHAVPDANVLTMAEQLHAAKIMARRVGIPVIADCDNGFGNAINVIRTVQDYEADGIAGICMEDNIFPKRCSFYAGVKRELVPPEEHAGKVRAAVEARRSKDFVVIARTEAYIAGWGLDEARRRAEAYAEAGADMILVHSKSPQFDELQRFAEQWDGPPLVAVPTIYKHVSAQELYDAGFKLVIFANHGLRSSLKAMKETFDVLMREQRAEAVDDRVVALEEVYARIGVADLKTNEAKYLPKGGESVTAVILAAGDSEHLGELTADRPKAMLEVRGKTILEHQIAALNACGVKDVAVVRGYCKDAVDAPGARFHDNDGWAEGGELQSLLAARSELEGRVVVLYGDVLFDQGILEKLLKSKADVALVADRSWSDRRGDEARPTPADLIREDGVSHDAHRFVPGGSSRVAAVGREVEGATSEFAGLAMFSPKGTEALLAACDAAAGASGAFHEAAAGSKAGLTDALAELVGREVDVRAVPIYKGWSEVDTFEDYRKAWRG